MKKLLFYFLLILNVTGLFAQKQVDRVTLPTKDDKVFYERIEVVDSNETKDQLFLKASKWAAENFVDNKEAIKLADKEQGKIVGSGLFTLNYNKLLTMDDYVSFDFDITIKDGKYRSQIYNIQTKGIESDYPFSSLDYMYFKQLKEDKFSFRKNYVMTCRGVDARLNTLLDSLKNVMAKSSSLDDF